MEKPEFDLDHEDGRKAMFEWLTFMLDQWLEEKVSNMEEPTDEEWEAMAAKRQQKRGRGRPPDPAAVTNRHMEEFMAEVIVPKIRELWRTHYDESNWDRKELVLDFAVQYFWGDADHEVGRRKHKVEYSDVFDRVNKHLGMRSNARKFSKPNYRR